MDDRVWMQLSNCNGMDSNLFIIDDCDKPEPVAVMTCNGCLVKDKCKGWALQRKLCGFWGGEHLTINAYRKAAAVAKRQKKAA